MKAKILLLTLILGATTSMLTAQDAPQPRRDRPAREGGPDRPGGPEGRRPGNPLMAALDLDKDGILNADEIAKASESLKKLDKNGDGQITREEVRPNRPEGRRGPREEGGPRRPRGEGRPPRPNNN